MKHVFFTVYKQIIPPLLAMMVLTLVVVWTVYQVTGTWEQEFRKMNAQLTQTLILNNLRWKLVKIQEKVETEPEQAQADWDQLKSQVRTLSKLPERPKQTERLSVFLSRDENLQHIPLILNQDFLRLNLDETQRKLTALQEYTGFVTQGVTVSMLALGLILMALTALDLGKLFMDLAKSRDLNNTLQEEERRRIAQELHDGVIQELIDLKRAYEPKKVDAMVENIRRICHNLKPQVLEDIGFVAGLEFLADDLRQNGVSTVTVSYDETELRRLPKDYELTLFRVVQELMNNVKRHAQASQVRLSLVLEPGGSPVLKMFLTDNGVGFDPQKAKRGLGLVGVEERVQRIGGRFKIESSPGQGTRFQIRIPV
jgi:signal transduction histidine kinase